MTNNHSFGQILRTSTLLAFALSFNAFNIQASEKGSFNGADFFYTTPKATVYKSPLNPKTMKALRMTKKSVQVKGYTTAATVSLTLPGGKEYRITDPITPPSPTTTPTLTVTSPNGGESWAAGSTHTITWDSTGIPENFDGAIMIDLYRDNAPLLSGSEQVPGNPGSFDLTLRNDLPTASDYRIRIMSCTTAPTAGYMCAGTPLYAEDRSDEMFTITSAAETPIIDLSVSGLQVRPRVNPYDPTDKYEIVVKIKNNSDTPITQYDLMRSIVRVTTGTNGAAIDACGVGTCQNVGNAYNAAMYLAAPSVANIPAHGEQEYPFNIQTFLGTRPEFTDGLQYTIKAIVDDNAYFNETNETNNTSSIHYSNPIQCALAGLRADVYGGPNHVCCTGLVLQGGVCNVPQPTLPDFIVTDLKIEQHTGDVGKYLYITLKNIGAAVTETGHILSVKIEDLDTGDVYTSGVTEAYPAGWTKEISSGTTVLSKASGIYRLKVTVDNVELIPEANESNNYYQETITLPTAQPERVTVCHKTGNGYTEIETNKNGWLNGHSQHDGDFIKTSQRPCRAPKVTVEPLSSVKTPVIKNTDDSKDALIKQLQDRIKKLEIRLSEVEQGVIEREKNRESQIDNALTKRLAGRLLLQTQEHGEVWYVDPTTQNKFFLKDGDSAYQALKAFGTGISESDFKKLTDPNFVKSLKGKIFLRVQAHGEAYYIDADGQAQYLKDGAAAYEVMKGKALGITNDDLSKVPTSSLVSQ